MSLEPNPRPAAGSVVAAGLGGVLGRPRLDRPRPPVLEADRDLHVEDPAIPPVDVLRSEDDVVAAPRLELGGAARLEVRGEREAEGPVALVDHRDRAERLVLAVFVDDL